MSFNTLAKFRKHPAYRYAESVVDGTIPSDEDIIIVCQDFLNEIEKKDSKYYFDFDFADRITDVTQLISMPNGLATGMTARSSLAGFQWFFIINAMVWKMKNNHEKRRYETSVLLIARKNGKTFITALLFVLLLLLEPRFSTFFSVAPDLELSSLIKAEMEKLISVSPYLRKHFKITKQEIVCIDTDSSFKPLATSNNRMDGRLANVFVADEVGALVNRYPIDAMESSQMNVLNRTGILISTAYETLDNPMTQEVEMAEKIIHGELEDDSVFALLYKPDDPKTWATSDSALLMANPLALDVPETYDFLKKQRERAIVTPEKRKNFLTKHMNIFVNGDEVEAFIKEEDLVRCETEEINWSGKDVYLGFDLSSSDDNSSVSMVAYDSFEGEFYAKSWAFYPAGRETEKTRLEKVDYKLMSEKGYSFATGKRIIDYNTVEEFILSIERTYGVHVKGIGYDRWNAAPTVARLSDEGYDLVEIEQKARGLYAGTKLLKEAILSEKFQYEKNDLLKMNFLNAKMVYDMNLSYFLNKKKSKGKIDMVASTVNCMALWQSEIVEGDTVDEGIIIL